MSVAEIYGIRHQALPSLMEKYMDSASMTKPPLYIVIIRYILVIGLLYAIWSGQSWAIKLTCTLCIAHSELLYVLNRLKEVDRGR